MRRSRSAPSDMCVLMEPALRWLQYHIVCHSNHSQMDVDACRASNSELSSFERQTHIGPHFWEILTFSTTTCTISFFACIITVHYRCIHPFWSFCIFSVWIYNTHNNFAFLGFLASPPPLQRLATSPLSPDDLLSIIPRCRETLPILNLVLSSA